MNIFLLALVVALALLGQPAQAGPFDGMEEYERLSDVYVYPRIAQKGSSATDRISRGRQATLNIPGYLVNLMSTCLLLLMTMAFVTQYSVLSATESLSWFERAQLSVVPGILVSATLYSMTILVSPGSLIASPLRFVPMLAHMSVAAILALNVAGRAKMPAVGEPAGISWTALVCILSTLTAWSWGVRVSGDSMLTPWIVANKRRRERSPQVRLLDVEVSSPDFDDDTEADTEVNEYLEAQEVMNKPSWMSSTASMLGFVASTVCTLYLAAVVYYGCTSAEPISPKLAFLLTPMLMASLVMLLSSLLGQSAASFSLYARLLLAVLAVLVVVESAFPGLLGLPSFLLVDSTSKDAQLFFAPLRDAVAYISDLPVLRTIFGTTPSEPTAPNAVVPPSDTTVPVSDPTPVPAPASDAPIAPPKRSKFERLMADSLGSFDNPDTMYYAILIIWMMTTVASPTTVAGSGAVSAVSQVFQFVFI